MFRRVTFIVLLFLLPLLLCLQAFAGESANKAKLKYSNISAWHKAGYTGKGVKVAVFERTPIDTNFPIFVGKVFDTMGEMHKDGVENTHCHNVVATLLTVAPDVQVYVYKNRYLKTKILKKAWDDGCCIVNLSSSRGNNSPYVTKPEKEYFEKGMLLVTSAGNYYDCMKGEALLPFWLSVGAIFIDDDGKIKKYDFSSTGEQLDLVNFAGIKVQNRHNTTTYFGGTSAACPYTVGMFALYYQWFKELHGRFPTPKEAHEFAFKNCRDLEEKGCDPKTGHGLFILPHPYKTEPRNPLAVKMVKPNGNIIYVHVDYVEETIEKKGYKLFQYQR